MTERAKKFLFYFTAFVIVFIGFLARLKLFIDNPSFWFDESALGFNILELNLRELFGILHLQQIAPPFFLASVKIIVNIFGASDMNLRLCPFFAGNISMLIFWLALKNIYKNKLTILTGLMLFCLNVQLIKYSVEFKPYIAEVFTTCLILYIFSKINFDFSYKKLFLLGVIIATLPWFAFISAVTASIAYLILFSLKNYKKWLTFFAPFGISLLIFVLYYIKVKSFYYEFMDDFWGEYFYTYKTFLSMSLKAFRFLFSAKLPFIQILFVLAGVVYYLRSKNKAFELNFSIFAIIFGIILSFLHKYPFYSRFLLYSYPLFLIIMLTIFEKIFEYKNKILTTISLIALLIFMLPATGYITSMTHQKLTKQDCARELIEDMSNRIKPNDIILVDTLSTPDFLYYNKYFKISNPVNFNAIQKNNRLVYKYDKNIPLPINKGNKYWFFSPWGSGRYTSLKYEYQNKCEFGGRILYLNGDKQ